MLLQGINISVQNAVPAKTGLIVDILNASDETLEGRGQTIHICQ